MRETFRHSSLLTVREWLRTAAWALRDGHWSAAAAALVFAGSAIRWRVSMLGELPPWVWMVAMLVVSAGCGSGDVSDAPIAASLVSALGAFAYALRTKVTTTARTQGVVERALEKRDKEIEKLREVHSAEVAQLRLLFEAALGREAAANRRCESMAAEFSAWRRDNGIQRSQR